jgi:hypothetical protein
MTDEPKLLAPTTDRQARSELISIGPLYIDKSSWDNTRLAELVTRPSIYPLSMGIEAGVKQWKR